jgi:hypothetical protein
MRNAFEVLKRMSKTEEQWYLSVYDEHFGEADSLRGTSGLNPSSGLDPTRLRPAMATRIIFRAVKGRFCCYHCSLCEVNRDTPLKSRSTFSKEEPILRIPTLSRHSKFRAEYISNVPQHDLWLVTCGAQWRYYRLPRSDKSGHQ